MNKVWKAPEQQVQGTGRKKDGDGEDGDLLRYYGEK